MWPLVTADGLLMMRSRAALLKSARLPNPRFEAGKCGLHRFLSSVLFIAERLSGAASVCLTIGARKDLDSLHTTLTDCGQIRESACVASRAASLYAHKL